MLEKEYQQREEQDSFEQPEDFTLRNLRPQRERDERAFQMETLLERIAVLEEKVTALEGGDTVSTIEVMTPDIAT